MRSLNETLPGTGSVTLFIAGARGQIGSELLTQLRTQQEQLSAREGLHLNVAGTANTQVLSFFGETPRARATGDWQTVLERLHDRSALFVDCTASPQIAALYPHFLECGVGVITPNKLAFSSDYAHYRLLHTLSHKHDAPLRYETAVGAALPVLAPLRELAARGESPERIEAVLSGTLSFLFARINSGMSFSKAVREAYDLGYTEPHPARDLAGEDTARKLVIMLRDAGIPSTLENVSVKPLLPAATLAEPDPIRFLERLNQYDADWRRRETQGPLACLARYEHGRASVEWAPVEPESPFARLEPRANRVHIHTKRYTPLPLTIAGPGAGTTLTAAGVLSDILYAASTLRARQHQRPLCRQVA
jgi:aspartokinase/homoserine dehydrogenase 1